MPRKTIIYSWRYLLRLSAVLWGVLFITLATSACITQQTLQMGMTSAEVIQILGEPDQIVYQDGKVLVPVANADEIDFAHYRVVLMYDDNSRQVWFENGVVNSMVQNGAVVPLPTPNPR